MPGASISAIAIAIASMTVVAGGAALVLGTDIFDSDDPVVVLPAEDLVYNGSYQQLLTISGTLHDAYFRVNGSEITGGTPEAKDAGRYSVFYRYYSEKSNSYQEGLYEVTISKKVITVTANNQGKGYGETEPSLTADESGVFRGDSISYDIYRDGGEEIGQYPIHVSGDKDQGNYRITFRDGTFTIDRKQVTVTANSQSKEYGTADPQLTATITGLSGSETVSYSISRMPGEDAGDYEIYVTGDKLQGNYEVTFVNGSFYIFTKAATVYAEDASKMFGDSDPRLTARIEGGTDIKYTITREPGEDVGTYVITVSGQKVQGNYLVTYVSGTFSILTASSSWTVLPEAIPATYDGHAHELITKGTASGGTAYYRLSTTEYSTTVPSASEPGTYTVYYKIVGGEGAADTAEAYLRVTIADHEWNGTEKNEPQKADGKYLVYTASELAWIAANNASKGGFNNTSIVLMHDIDLTDDPWTPIGTSSNPFKGNFDGNGMTIRSLLIKGNSSYVGLFGCTSGGTIKNLNIDGANVDGSEYVAVIAGYLGSATSDISICHANISGNRHVGCIAGYQKANITDVDVEYIGITCNRTNDSIPYLVSYMGNAAGGISGSSEAAITGATASHLTLSAYKDVGGITGSTQDIAGTLNIKNNSVTMSTIIVSADGGNAGKICGRVSDSTLMSGNSSEYVTIMFLSSDQEQPMDLPNTLADQTFDYMVIETGGKVTYYKGQESGGGNDIYKLTLKNITIDVPDDEEHETIPAIDIKPGCDIVLQIEGEVTLKGGIDADAIRVPTGSSVVITGSGKLTVIGNNGKEYSAEKGYNYGDSYYNKKGGSGIGNSGSDSTLGTGQITISNLGEIDAYGYGDNGYGIGGDGATVIISDSRVRMARGGFNQVNFVAGDNYGSKEAEGAPGIGGATIVISGSVIDDVFGGSKAAGIGGRFWMDSDITIANSTISNVIGGNGSAGIGGSHPNHHTSTDITIKINIVNSKVKATGGYYGAGIGSGYDKCTGSQGVTHLTITISSHSDITAYGGAQASGIGTGFHSGLLEGSIDSTVVLDVKGSTVYKSGGTYSLMAQDIGYGVVDYSREAAALMDGSTPVSPTFSVGGQIITNPFDPDRLSYIQANH